MKKYISVLGLVLLISLNGFSQNVIPLYGSDFEQIDVYYKDTHNDFDNYTGIWKYTSGSTSLTITLQKKIQQTVYNFDGSQYQMDFIVGGYKYVENGIEKINTLSQLSQNLDIIQYRIYGSSIIAPHSIYCMDCGPNDRKLLLGFSEPNRHIDGYEPEMLFQRADRGGVQKLKLIFRTTSGGWEEEGVTPQYTSYTIPFGEYVLVKQ